MQWLMLLLQTDSVLMSYIIADHPICIDAINCLLSGQWAHNEDTHPLEWVEVFFPPSDDSETDYVTEKIYA